jgi:hypothetical protein
LINLLFGVFLNNDQRFNSKFYDFLEDRKAREAAEEEAQAADKNKKVVADPKKKEAVEEVVIDDDDELDRSEIKVGDSLDQKTHQKDLDLFKRNLTQLCKIHPNLYDKS